MHSCSTTAEVESGHPTHQQPALTTTNLDIAATAMDTTADRARLSAEVDATEN